MAPIPEMSQATGVGQEWMAVALGVVLTVCVSLSIALIVVMYGGKQKEPEAKEGEAPTAPSGDSPPPEEKQPSAKDDPKRRVEDPAAFKLEPSAKEPPAAKEASAKAAPSATTGPSAKGVELKLTSEKPGASAVGKSAKAPMVDLKKQPSLQLQANTTKK